MVGVGVSVVAVQPLSARLAKLAVWAASGPASSSVVSVAVDLSALFAPESGAGPAADFDLFVDFFEPNLPRPGMVVRG